jgi:hypothetical protein
MSVADLPPGSEDTSALRRTAMSLQRSLLPARLPVSEELDVAVRYAAGAADVAGDWYDVIALGGGRLALVIGDVMGRGVPAAAADGPLRTAARTCARLDLRPGEGARRARRLLCDLDLDAIATCVYAVFDPGTRELRQASAGHLPPRCAAAAAPPWPSTCPQRAARAEDRPGVLRAARPGLAAGALDGRAAGRARQRRRRGHRRDLRPSSGAGPDDAEAICDAVLAQLGGSGDTWLCWWRGCRRTSRRARAPS